MPSIQDRINNRRASDTDNIDEVLLRWSNYKSPSDANALYKYLEPTVSSAISSYAGGDKSFRVKAFRIAFDSLSSYDPSKGANIKTHVYNNLKRLNRVYADRSNIIHIPEGVAKDSSAISKAITGFYDEHGREPTDDELSDITKLSISRINKILGNNYNISESEAVTPEGADKVSSKGISDSTYIDYLYSSVDATDKKIIEYMTGRNNRKVLSGMETARRLNMTPAAVSQRINKLRASMADLKSLL